MRVGALAGTVTVGRRPAKRDWIIVDAVKAPSKPGSMRRQVNDVQGRWTMRGAFAVTLARCGVIAARARCRSGEDAARRSHGAEMSFDPQFSADAGSDGIIDHIYESMLDYDYLVRPMKLVPRTLEAMPTV